MSRLVNSDAAVKCITDLHVKMQTLLQFYGALFEGTIRPRDNLIRARGPHFDWGRIGEALNDWVTDRQRPPRPLDKFIDGVLDDLSEAVQTAIECVEADELPQDGLRRKCKEYELPPVERPLRRPPRRPS